MSTSVSTGKKYEYKQVWERLSSCVDDNFLVLFEVEARSDAHVWLEMDSGGYEIVIGGWNNSRSEIRRGKQGKCVLACIMDDAKPLNASGKTKFWMTVKQEATTSNNAILVGKGWEVGKNTFLVGKDKKKFSEKIESMSVSTGFGFEGKWIIHGHQVEEDVLVAEQTHEPDDSPKWFEPAATFTPIRSTLILSSTRSTSSPSVLLKRPRHLTSGNTAPPHDEENAAPKNHSTNPQPIQAVYFSNLKERAAVRSTVNRSLARHG